MHKLLQRLLFLGGLAAAAAAGAQMTFWDGPGFAGRTFTANQTIPNFADLGYNDRASSAVIRGGTWQVCSDAYFRGNCATLGPGQYPDLGSMGLAYAISSAREMSGWPGAGGVGGGGSRGGRVILYDGNGFTGRTYDVNGTVVNFDGTGFNDRARSMIINEGSWELCMDAQFGGYCQTYRQGNHSNLGSLSGQLSSMRQVLLGGAVGGAGWGGGSRAILYEGPNLSGRTYVISGQVVPNLDGTGFNDRASSLRVEGGYWIFCSDANFNGECQTFGPGDYPSLPWGLNNRISSGRRVHGSYPYNATPNWSGQQ